MERWLRIINLEVGRGSEFRAARKLMLGPNSEATSFPADAPPLALRDFVSVYEDELRQGKVWGVAWDLNALGVWDDLKRADPEDYPPFEARFDRIYASPGTTVLAVRDAVSTAPCPNSRHASDHLPTGATIRLDGDADAPQPPPPPPSTGA